MWKMKILPGVLPFLILATALGPPAHASLEPRSPGNGVHRPTDCCFTYTPRNIRCEFMEDYFLTSSGCSQPGVIFKTRGGQKVCVHPSAAGVQECMEKLASANTEKTVH